MGTDAYTWSFFIAHAGADKEAAEALYERLAPHAPTFLDSRCIELGADWDLELARAQKDALVSVVLVSSNTKQAYYQREEIAAAIDLARTEGKRHRVVPVFLDSDAAASTEVPYGLRLKHGLTLTDGFGLDEVAGELLGLVRRLQGQPGTVPPPVRPRWPAPRRRAAWLYGGAAAAAVVVLGTLAWFTIGPQDGQRPGPAAELAPAPGAPVSPPVAAKARLPSPGGAAPVERCMKVEYFSPNVIPHYLLNSLGSENFPYWLRIVAKNGCDENRIMTLRFERGDNIALENPPQQQDFTILRGETSPRTFNPKFNLASEQPDSVAIYWSIEDEKRTKIGSDSIRTEIVPPLTVAWDLQKPSAPGQRIPVEPEYLLGSLKAWILKPPRRVADIGKACRTTPKGGVILEKEDAIKACYRHLFLGDNPVPVSDSPISFPAGARQRIRPHIDLIGDRQNKASSLEAALLFAAVVEVQHKDGVDYDLVLVIGPVEGQGDPNRKTAFIAWREAGQAWRAIDLRLANARTFEANTASASRQVGAIIGFNSEIADAVDNKGAGFSKDGKFAAVNFRKVPPQYRIRALP